ncbi:hypothetical protein P3L10_025884 [Capsicum annuum]
MSWNESTDCCTWDGVTCDMLTGHVIGVDLSCSLLHGTIHPNSSLVQVHHLQTLNLENNYFNYSSIPNDIGRLRNLRHPTFPTLPFMETSHQKFHNFQIWFHLYVDLESTNLQGILTNSFFDLPNLEILNLGYNGISGELPDSIGTLKSLNYLYLFQCAFSGSIPDSIGNLTQIRQLDFSKNNFTSHNPSTISKLKMLTPT